MQITFDKKNYRKHSEQNKKRIRKSLTECGAGRSVLVDKDGCLIAGNGVFEQAEKMGIKTRVVETDGTELVVVKRTDIGTDDPKRKELALADNATSDNVEWDLPNIVADFDVSVAEDWGIDVDLSVEEEPKEAQEDDFDDEKDPVATICQEGDVWQLGEHRLMCGDSTKAEDVARLMDGEKAQLVITDPPYNVAIGSKNKALNEIQESGRIVEDIIGDKGMTDEEIGEKIWAPAFKNLCDFATDDCAIYVSMPQGGTHMMMMMMMSRYWQVKHELIWLENAPTFSMGRLNYDYKHEPIVYGWKKKHNWYAKEPKQSILCFDKPKKCDLHPTMKPIALWAELICNSSQEGMIVSDFFGGSGSTLIAAEQLGRKCYMMELDPHYCDVIIARWEKLTGQKAVKL
jgi:site-specific DNA-methyltransferase (adenine-specific)